jgi:uncharacterized LabA/DUF88 family protein
MRAHCAVYVDAGYLIAAAATRVTGTSLRSSVNVDHDVLIAKLAAYAESQSGLPLLRVHWYDASREGVIEPTHERIGLLPRVKVRLGRTGYDGEQKGVDLRIGLDLVGHARNGAVEVMYLVSGDDDLTEAVEEAQVHGVQVMILGVPTNSGGAHGVSRHLHRASDGLELVDGALIDDAVKAAISRAPIAKPQPLRPSPASLASRRFGQAPACVAVPTKLGANTVYSSTTDRGSTMYGEFKHTPEELDAVIDAVAERVAVALLSASDTNSRTELI